MPPKLLLLPTALSNYVRGTREPDFDTLLRIADYFGVSTDYLLGHTPSLKNRTEDEQLLAAYHSFSPTQKEYLLAQIQLIKHLAKKEK